jgi:hypothetical protein
MNPNINNEEMKNSGFGSNPNGEMFGKGVPDSGTPMEAGTLGQETSFGSDPGGEMFGMPAPDKQSMVNGLTEVTGVIGTSSIGALTLPTQAEEGTRGET